MFDIFTTTHFSSAHHLRDYPGNCEKPHGHNWKVEVTIRADSLDQLGMGLDFRDLKGALKPIIDQLDHRDLNQHPAFADHNPSSENIAKHIFDELKKALTTKRYRPYQVTVLETDACGVTYRE
ncbi:MAG TPA: 6-carboxytetrahydropterin synthase QueD [Desulfurivibrio alkaliphilus]|uniref:6-carboxy-5,6,7,8-tetrahydropterin synthase n=1 Tax=Desulfurivibrio alkaliphilus TaxID=427923 RepID=A0A7C2XA72_9BACT|nr:6-carboxytetrahydropterin synthase QueD [Desulfurivibrio alkaliphilus]